MRRKRGFTMIESLLALVLISLIAVLLSYGKYFNQKYHDNSDTISYYSFLQSIEQSKYQFSIKSLEKNVLRLYSSSQNKVYLLYKYRNNLVLTGAISGYMPVLKSVKLFQVIALKKHVEIIVKFVNGQYFHNRLLIPNEK
jgi:competence protein ComGF